MLSRDVRGSYFGRRGLCRTDLPQHACFHPCSVLCNTLWTGIRASSDIIELSEVDQPYSTCRVIPVISPTTLKGVPVELAFQVRTSTYLGTWTAALQQPAPAAPLFTYKTRSGLALQAA